MKGVRPRNMVSARGGSVVPRSYQPRQGRLNVATGASPWKTDASEVQRAPAGRLMMTRASIAPMRGLWLVLLGWITPRLRGWPRQLVVWVPEAQEDSGHMLLLSLRDTDNKLSVPPAPAKRLWPFGPEEHRASGMRPGGPVSIWPGP